MNRNRRLRQNSAMRNLIRETTVLPSELVYPIFVADGRNIKNPVPSMPGIYQYSVDRLDDIMEEVAKSGIAGVMIFGVPSHKDSKGSEAYRWDGVAQKGIKYIKSRYPGIVVIADICLCAYTTHGHCGIVKDGKILNDETLPYLAEMALTCVQAGADMVAPSDMMDGRVEYIRNVLDSNNFKDIPIMAYSAKYASAYYGPFRDAAHSAPQFGDRKTYQMDFANIKEAAREIASDIEEGADIVMVKPALAYLDVIKEASERFDVPVAAYNVSGEYAMVKSAAAAGWIDEKKVILENLYAIKRAGANIIITYHAVEAAAWLEESIKNQNEQNDESKGEKA